MGITGCPREHRDLLVLGAQLSTRLWPIRPVTPVTRIVRAGLVSETEAEVMARTGNKEAKNVSLLNWTYFHKSDLTGILPIQDFLEMLKLTFCVTFQPRRNEMGGVVNRSALIITC